MAAVPLTFNGVFYPSNKKDPPIKGTFFGNAFITGLGVGGGPIEPPPDIPVPPDGDLIIWGGPFEPPVVSGGPIDPHPDIGFPIEPPPVEPPSTPQKPHEGWNWSVAKSGWYLLIIPGEGEAGPK